MRAAWVILLLSLGFLILFPISLAAKAIRPQIGVYYFPGWCRSGESAKPPFDKANDVTEWRSAIAKAPYPRALLGFYDDSDPRLWSYYLNWMKADGIDFIAFDWYYNAGQQYLSESLDQGFLRAAQEEHEQFCLHWCNHGGFWWTNALDQSREALVKMADFAATRYFKRPNYLKHDGKPVFMIYDTEILLGFGGPAKVRENIATLRQTVQKRGFPDVYLVAVYSDYGPENIRQLRELGFDAFCGYTYPGLKSARVNWDSQSYPYREVADRLIRQLYPFWQKEGETREIPYWPTVFSGWDNSPRIGGAATILTGNTPEEFGRLFRAALRQVNPASPFVVIEAWNEWGEGADIEPSVRDGFGYLEQIARALGKAEQRPMLPKKEEIASWSMLHPEEIEGARKNESKPWPQHEPKWFQFGRNQAVPDVHLPVVIDFGSSGISFENIFLNHMKVLDRDNSAVTFLHEGNQDSGIEINTQKIPLAQIKSIEIEATLTGDSSPEQLQGEFFWSTSYMPQFSPYCSIPVIVRRNGSIELSTDEMPGWNDSGTPLTRIRIDFGKRPQVTIRLWRVLLSDRR